MQEHGDQSNAAQAAEEEEEEEEEEEGEEEEIVVTLEEVVEILKDSGQVQPNEERQHWAMRNLVNSSWPQDGAERRYELEDTELRCCEQWYGQSREQHYNDDTEKLLQVA